MAIRLAPLEHITVRRPTAQRRPPSRSWAFALGAIARCVLVGLAIGIFLVSGQTGIVTVVTIGILAIGVALLSWDA